MSNYVYNIIKYMSLAFVGGSLLLYMRLRITVIMCNVVGRMCEMLWKLQSEGRLHGGSLGHITVHRYCMTPLRNYSPDEKIS